MESGLLLDVVVGEGATVLELLAGEDQTLLVRGDAKEWSVVEMGRATEPLTPPCLGFSP
jgi:hypothetical protein